MPYSFSSSTLSLLKDCPRCFWLHFNGKIRRPNSIFPSLPSGMDGILKEYFDSHIKTGKLPNELSELNGNTKLFSDKQLLEKWRNFRQGLRWQDGKGNVLRGALDTLLEVDGKLVVLDYKTRGYPLNGDTADYYQDQLDIYNFLLNKNGFETHDFAFLLFYFPKKVNNKGHVEFGTTLLKKNVQPQNALLLFENALQLLQKDCPTKECDWCKKVVMRKPQATITDFLV